MAPRVRGLLTNEGIFFLFFSFGICIRGDNGKLTNRRVGHGFSADPFGHSGAWFLNLVSMTSAGQGRLCRAGLAHMERIDGLAFGGSLGLGRSYPESRPDCSCDPADATQIHSDSKNDRMGCVCFLQRIRVARPGPVPKASPVLPSFPPSARRRGRQPA